jgi:hypothetical protein
MTDDFTQGSPADLPGQLAAAAGAGELAAAAAIDAEEGDKFLHGLLADQMATAHLLTMRMAAAADRAIAAAADDVGRSDDNLPLFDLAAARFAGAAARLNGRYCRGLQTLRALAAPAAEEDEDIEWVGFTLPLYGEDEEMTPAERTRRINREKSYLKLRQLEEGIGRESAAGRRPIDAAEQAALAAAGNAARELVTAAGVEPLAVPSSAQHTKLFAHQLAVSHRLMMRLSGRADDVVTAAADPLDRPEGLRLAHGAARLMERFRQGVAMLKRMRTDPDGPRRTGRYWSGPISAYDREEDRAEDIAAGIDPDTGLLVPTSARRATVGKPVVASAPAGLSAVAPSAKASVLHRRGRLNNGNPGGDFLAAPRCGARTRAGCSCRQPAMANGRCRFHGGKSTGPRTQAGRARARSNRLVHGLRSAELIALAAAAAAAHRRLGALLAAGTSKKIHHREDRGHREEGAFLARAARNRPSSVLSVSSVVNPSSLVDPSPLMTPSPAGHGVDRSESTIAAGGATILPFTRPAPARPPCRNRLPRVRS